MTRILTAAIATCALLALPSAAQAATNFGSRLNHNPANSGECALLPSPCTLASYIHPSDPNGDPYAGGAPVDGVITKFRIRGYGLGGPASVTFRLATVALQNPPNDDVALGQAAGTGPTVTIPEHPTGNDVPILEFPGRVPVKTGDQLAIDGTNIAATYNSSGDKYSYKFDQPLVDGQAGRASDAATGELLVAASIEPDADRDGFGDETQDGCPSQATAQGACGTTTTPDPTDRAVDRTKPRLRGLKVVRGTLRFRLSEPAKVTVRIKKGRRTVKMISATRNAGPNRLALKPRRLARGRYTIAVSARDSAGNKSAPKRVGLRVKR